MARIATPGGNGGRLARGLIGTALVLSVCGWSARGAAHGAQGPLGAQQLAALLPARVAAYRAVGPASAIDVPAPGGRRIPRASRRYTDGQHSLLLEIIDPLQAPAVLSALRSGQRQSRRTSDRMAHGMDVGGQWVMTQWTPADRAARVGALLDGRLVYSLTVVPAETIEPGVAVAAALDYAAARALVDGAAAQ